MKELSLEQKARAYDKALERARALYSQGAPDSLTLESMFPELAESEDEKIRRCIGMCLTDVDEQRFKDFNTNLKDCLNWLEKQGEQKSLNDVAKEIIKNKETAKSFLREVANEYKVEQGEQKPTQETESFKAEHGKYYYCIKDYFCGGKKQASKGDVVQALRGMSIMALKDISEYFLPLDFIKCNFVWSEEDEKIVKDIIEYLEYWTDFDCGDEPFEEYCARFEKYIEWMKQIKNRVTQNERNDN